MRGHKVLGIAMCGFLLAGCTTSSPEALAANDPFEPMNRAVWNFDEKFDKYVVLNVAGFWLLDLPRPARIGLRNFFSNLDLPVTFANDLLQGQVPRAAHAFGRFALNSTMGLGGFLDVATPAGFSAQRADFGQTLSIYGVGEGPFLVLPLIGPDPPRDLVGDAADIFLSPLTYLPPALPLLDRASIATGVEVMDPLVPHARDIFLRRELEKGSLDPYATMRSTYRQVREMQINGGVPQAETGQ